MKSKMNRFLVALVSSTVVAVSAQAPDVLDLTQPRHRADSTASSGPVTGSAVGFSPHTVKLPSGVQLRLESLDRNVYRDGEPFEFRVSLTNTTRQPVTLPWDPDPQQVVTGPDAPLIKALLVIDVEPGRPVRATGPHPRGGVTVPIATLYGSKLSPGNTKVLQAGARAEVIARGHWEFRPYSSEDLRAAGFPATVNVGARLSFLTSIDGNAYDDLSSANRISIALNRRDTK
jgi:hypothetical protein